MAKRVTKPAPAPKPEVDDNAAAEAAEQVLSFDSPESSNVAGADYDPQTQTLRIRFKGHDGEEERSYTGTCDITLWQDFLQAPSKGSFFAGNIKPFVGLVRQS